MTLILSLLFLTVAKSSNSQDSLLKVIPQPGATYTALHPISLDSVISKLRLKNFFVEEAKRQRSIADSLRISNSDLLMAVNVQRRSNDIQQEIIDAYATKEESYEESLKLQDKLLKRKNRWNWFWKSLSAALGIKIGIDELKDLLR